VSLPNIITLVRLLAVPLVVWLILQDRSVVAFWVFIGAGLSDAIDGFLARQLDLRTTLGTYLDPLADKALLVSVYVALGLTTYLPDWLVILVVFRDVMIIGGVVLVALITGLLEMRPLWISKVNTTMQIVLAGFALGNGAYGLDMDVTQMLLVFVVAGTTVLSGAAYVRQLVRRAPALEERD